MRERDTNLSFKSTTYFGPDTQQNASSNPPAKARENHSTLDVFTQPGSSSALLGITSDDVLDTAYDWLCRRRRAYPADTDVWSFRQAWPQEKNKIKAALAAGRFRFGLLTRIT